MVVLLELMGSADTAAMAWARSSSDKVCPSSLLDSVSTKVSGVVTKLSQLLRSKRRSQLVVLLFHCPNPWSSARRMKLA